MVNHIRIIEHARSVDSLPGVADYRVVTVVDGVIVSDLHHTEGVDYIKGVKLKSEFIGHHYNPKLYPGSIVEKWFDHEGWD